MKSFIVDFKSVTFEKGKMHGGGLFAINLIQQIIDQGHEIFIINNTSDYFDSISISSFNTINFGKKIIYIDPLFVTVNSEIPFQQFHKSFFYVHGTRILEMPYDNSSHEYFKGLKKLKVFFSFFFGRNLIQRKVVEQVRRINGIQNAEILCPSEHSKFILKTFLNTVSIEVLPPLVSQHEKIETVKNISSPYILILNADRWVKNSHRFIKAYLSLSKNKLLPKDLKLVLVGGSNKRITKNHRNIINLSYLNRSQLEWLIANCLFLAYPSLNEGFGYPPLDAMKYGKPVLCTSISAPNIHFNGKVTFTNPYSILEIQSRILFILNSIENGRINNEDLEEFYNVTVLNTKMKWEKWLHT